MSPALGAVLPCHEERKARKNAARGTVDAVLHEIKKCPASIPDLSLALPIGKGEISRAVHSLLALGQIEVWGEVPFHRYLVKVYKAKGG